MKKVIYGAFLVLAASCCVSLAAPEPAMVQAAGFPSVKARKPENLPLSVAFCRAYVRGRKG